MRRHQEGTRTYPEQDCSPQIFYRGSYHEQRTSVGEIGGTLLRPLLQREHCVALSPSCCRMPADHGRTRHRANFGGAQQGHQQQGLWQGPWQRQDPPIPTAFSACILLSVLARSCASRHEGRQDHHSLQRGATATTTEATPFSASFNGADQNSNESLALFCHQ